MESVAPPDVLDAEFIPSLVESEAWFWVEVLASIGFIVPLGDPIGFDPTDALTGVGEGMWFPAVEPRFCEELFTLAAWLLPLP